MLNLKDLLPTGINCNNAGDKSLDSAFRATKLEFILQACNEDEDIVDLDSKDTEHEWKIESVTSGEYPADANLMESTRSTRI